MQPDTIDVSYVVTVFNKEPYIGYTAKSLLQQEGGIPSEYIFVDDVSSDRSVEVLTEATRGAPNVTIVTNSTNAGPSIRLNQAARLARGKYLQFMDSDDILAANATSVMLRLIEEHNADVVHGGWERTETDIVLLLGRRIDDSAPYTVSHDPLRFLFEQRIRRMSQLVRRDTFMAAGGCDERVFIQDESLALRLARVSQCFIRLHAPVLLIPRLEGELSRNIAQRNHDRFLAHYGMLQDFPQIDEALRRRIYRRCISTAWKQERLARGHVRGLLTPAFARYLKARCALPAVDDRQLQRMREYFAALPGVRRVG